MNHKQATVEAHAYDDFSSEDSREDRTINEVINAAKFIHEELGPGLLEEVYEDCLCKVLRKRGIPYKCRVAYPITFMGEVIDYNLDLDLVVDDCLIVELKSVDKLKPTHEAKLLTCLKMSQATQCLLINFNEPLLEKGIKRFVKKTAR